MRFGAAAVLAGALAASSPAFALADGFDIPPGFEARPVSFGSLPGWEADDHAAAFRAFRRTCEAIVDEEPAIRRARVQPPANLVAACTSAIAFQDPVSAAARQFFETLFEPIEVTAIGGRNFLTGYYEPDFEGSRVQTAEFTTPLLALPDDLVRLGYAETAPGLPPGTSVARRTATGLEPYPDRAAIEAGALGPLARPLVYVRDAVEAFFIQVQGSARIRFADGGTLRIGYAGRNGLPYTSIARLLVQKLGIPPAQMSAETLVTWLRANPAEGRELMARNRSFVFFRVADELGPEDGPIGSAGVSVIAGRSIAIDPAIWSYGLPVWLQATLPSPEGDPVPLRRLTVAQDSGAAITGATRADLFLGTGEVAGRQAGLIREDMRFIVLWPNSESAAPARR